MRRGYCKIWILPLGIALAVSGVSCGGTDAPAPSSPPVDPQVAFKQYEATAKPFECSYTYREMEDAAIAGNFGIMKSKAFQYRDVLATMDGQLGKTDFPAAAQPIVKTMHELFADELAGLNELGRYDGKDKDRLDVLRSRIWFDDASLILKSDDLRAALGHQKHQAGFAADQLELAQATFYNHTAPVHAKWSAAMAAKDLAGAKAANDIEIDAAQRYIDTLDAIDWPPGTFEGQANILRDHLRGLIGFDRRQVDVASAADIVEVPAEGVPDVKGAADAKDQLWTDLVKNYQASEPGAKC